MTPQDFALSRQGALGGLEMDSVLMVGVREGHAEFLDELLRRYRDPVIGFLYRMTGDVSVAEDLAQEVFLRIYRSRSRYEPTARFSTWMYRIATNLALNWRRDRGKERGSAAGYDLDQRDRAHCLADARPGVDERLARQADARRIRRIVESLPPRQRAVVVLHHYHELSYAEMAQVLDCSPQAVKSLVFRAYTTLRERLASPAD